jgi:membrane associated rhomboid family serine protease
VIAGATVISVASQAGFKIGDNILISGGGQSEMKAIAGFGSIILEKPLENGYPAGSVVKLLEVTATTTNTSLPPRMPETVGPPRSLSPARVYVDTTRGRPLVTVYNEPQTTTYVTHPAVAQQTPNLVEVVRSRPQSPSLERVVEPPVIKRTLTPVRMPEPANEVPTEITLSVEPPKPGPEPEQSLTQELCDEIKEFFIEWFSAGRFSDVPCSDEGYSNRGKKMDRATAALRKEGEKKKAARAAGEGSQNLSAVVPGAATEEAEEEDDGDQFLDSIEKLQTLPIFVVLQCLGTFFMWALMSMEDTTESIGGLDAWYPGWTDLALTDLSCADYRSQAYRWWSYQFTHANFTHIATNVVLVVLMGIPLEGHNGTLGLFLMFNLGVFGGACCFMVNDPHSRVVGMSGGCYSLLGMHVGDLVQNWKERKYNYAKLAMIMSLAVVDMTLAFLSSSSKTSHSAHFGGWIAGCVACVVFGANTVPRRHEKYVMYFAALGGLGLTIFCLFWGLEWAPQNIWDQERYCWLRQIYSEASQQWQCVICDSLECAQSWSDNFNADFIKPVSRSACGDMLKVTYEDPAFAR